MIAVLTGADAVADGMRPLTHSPMPANPHEEIIRAPTHVAFVAPHPPMPADRVRFVGEVVAMVIAETPAAARDGAERVVVDWAPLPAVTASPGRRRARRAASSTRTPPSNVCVDVEVGDAAAVDAAFARPPTSCGWTRGSSASPACRWSRAPRSATGTRRAAATPFTPAPAAWGGRSTGVAGALGVPESAVRVVARDVGGNFGTRNSCYPEFALVAWAARRLGRPVKWTAERREAFLADYHGRDLAVARRAGARRRRDASSRFRAANTSNVGAHAVSFHPLNKGTAIATTVYHVPAVAMRGARRGHQHVAHHAVPQRRPARDHVRHGAADRPRRAPSRLRSARAAPAEPGARRAPCRTATAVGMVYDSGDYRGGARSRGRRSPTGRGSRRAGAEARRRGRYRGIGVANYIELNTGDPRERAHITVQPEGRIDLVLGTLSSGQGHATSFAQLLVEWLGVELAEVRLITGDTDVTVAGGGAHSARALRLAAVVMAKASDQIVEKGRRIAAWLLEAARGRHRVLGATLPREGHRPLGRSVRGRAAACGRRPPTAGAARRPERRGP